MLSTNLLCLSLDLTDNALYLVRMKQFPLAHKYQLEELELDALLYNERVYSLHMGRQREAEGVLKREERLRKSSLGPGRGQLAAAKRAAPAGLV